VSEEPHLIIAISRQFGAGGAYLGRRLSSRLGFAYLDREILRHAAERVGSTEESLAHWDERLSRFWERVIDSFAVGPPESIYTSFPGQPAVRDRKLFEIESRVIRELAARRSAVVIGRGGWWVLRDHAGLLRVFLHAPPESRAPRVQKAYGLPSEDDALAMIERVDRDRERFMRSMTGRGLIDACNYDLSIDTCATGFEAAEEMVMCLLAQVRQRLASTA
jgi:CMP/dCMP kinase